MPEFNFLYQNKSDFVKSPNDFGANGSTLILIENSNNNYGEIKILNAPSDSLLIKIDKYLCHLKEYVKRLTTY
mgnify:CR=1 FL=1